MRTADGADVTDRRGIVEIRQDVEVQLPWHRFIARWQRPPDAAATEERGWSDLGSAIEWARRRAPIVTVLLGEGWHEVYNAGERDADASDPRWKGAVRRRAANVDPDYGGEVFVGEERPWIQPIESYTATWLDTDGEPLERQDGFSDVEDAIDWARERAEVVLVAEVPSSYIGPPWYEIRSAGDGEPPGDQLERLRPRRGEQTMRWAITAQRAAAVLAPSDLAARLEDVLRASGDAFEPACSLLPEPPLGWSLTGITATDAASAHQFMEDMRDRWIDVTFTVEAPRRQAARDRAVRVLFAALDSLGEPPSGALGGFDVRPASSDSGTA